MAKKRRKVSSSKISNPRDTNRLAKFLLNVPVFNPDRGHVYINREMEKMTIGTLRRALLKIFFEKGIQFVIMPYAPYRALQATRLETKHYPYTNRYAFLVNEEGLSLRAADPDTLADDQLKADNN